MTAKSGATAVLKEYINWVKNRNEKITYLRLNNGGEYIENKFQQILKENRIQPKYMALHVPIE
jgi:hypothetical protein